MRYRLPTSIGSGTHNVRKPATISFGKYTSIGQALRLILAEEGAAALWKGLVPAQYLSLVFCGVQFVAFEHFEQLAHVHAPDLSATYSSTVSFCAGMASGALAGTASLPMDVLRTRFVAQGERKVRALFRSARTRVFAQVYVSTWQAARDMYKHEGVLCFYRGFIPTIVQIAPVTGVFACARVCSVTGLRFMFYHFCVNAWHRVVRRVDVSTNSKQRRRNIG
jgi:solute carrier family 25 thiamine pyrophosphate transporter 19